MCGVGGQKKTKQAGHRGTCQRSQPAREYKRAHNNASRSEGHTLACPCTHKTLFRHRVLGHLLSHCKMHLALVHARAWCFEGASHHVCLKAMLAMWTVPYGGQLCW